MKTIIPTLLLLACPLLLAAAPSLPSSTQPTTIPAAAATRADRLYSQQEARRITTEELPPLRKELERRKGGQIDAAQKKDIAVSGHTESAITVGDKVIPGEKITKYFYRTAEIKAAQVKEVQDQIDALTRRANDLQLGRTILAAPPAAPVPPAKPSR